MANQNGGAKRIEAQRARDRRLIAHLYLTERWTQVEIAEYLNAREDVDYTLSQATVSNDIRYLIDRWRESALVDINAVKAEELARINALELEYWDAWNASKKDAETASHEVRTGFQPGTKEIRTEAGQTGNPAYLAGVQWCIERRCKIFGLNAPENSKIDIGDVVLRVVYGSDTDAGDSPPQASPEAALLQEEPS